jgi:cobalt/nickel transport system ATP-binding protein
VCHYLSGGEKRKVALAGALVLEPELLVLDEPFEGLDPTSRSEMVELLNGLNREHGVSLVIATHDVQLVAPLADRVYVLKAGGEIVAQGPPSDLFQDLDLLRSSNIEPPVLAEVFQRLEALGYPLGRPQTPAEASVLLVRWMQAERERSAAAVALAMRATHAGRPEASSVPASGPAGTPPGPAPRP